MEAVGDPATGLPIGDTGTNLKAAIAGETHEYTDMYPGMAKAAREEGFDEIADWFETLAKAEKSHAGRFQKGLNDRLRRVGRGVARPRPPARSLMGAGMVTDDRHSRRPGRRPRRHARRAVSPSHRLARSGLLRHGQGRGRAGAGVRHLPRLPALLQSVRQLPEPVRPDRRGPTGELDGVDKADYSQVVDACTLCDMCFMTKCPYVPPHEFDVDFPHLMLRHRAAERKQAGGDFVARPAGRDRPQRQAGQAGRAPGQLGDRKGNGSPGR